MGGETVTIKEVWLDPTKVNESGKGKWEAILARWSKEGSSGSAERYLGRIRLVEVEVEL